MMLNVLSRGLAVCGFRQFSALASRPLVYQNVIQTDLDHSHISTHAVVSQPLAATISSIQFQQIRTYKVRTKLKLRCAGCYFERRHGRMYVECTIKGRHKQMMKATGFGIFKDDYAKGRWREAIHWNYHENLFYQSGNTQTSRITSSWMRQRLGKDL